MEEHERDAFLRRVNSAGVDEFTDIVLRASREQQEVLAEDAGEERFTRFQELALRRAGLRAAGDAGNVVVIHGIMGSELTSTDRSGGLARLWLNAPLIALGRLRLAADGRRPYDARYDVHASGILKRHYGELLLTLAAESRGGPAAASWRSFDPAIGPRAGLLAAELAQLVAAA